MANKRRTPGSDIAQNLGYLLKEKLDPTAVAACTALAEAMETQLDLPAPLTASLRLELIEFVIKSIVKISQSQAIEASRSAIRKGEDDIFLVSAAGELLGLHDRSAFALLLQIRGLASTYLDRRFEEKSYQTPWRQRQLTARLWLGEANNNYSYKATETKESDITAALWVAIGRYIQANQHELVRLLEGHDTVRAEHLAEAGTTLAQVARAVFAQHDIWPFSIIAASRAKHPDWRTVLDGSPITPSYVAHGMYVHRRVVAQENEMGEAEFASWLSEQKGGTVLLHGSTGDGKSSYVNGLAVGSADSHVFLRWPRAINMNLRMLRDFQLAVQAQIGLACDAMPTIIVSVTLPPYDNQLVEAHLITELQTRQLDGDNLVVLIDGRTGDLNRISRRIRTHRVNLAAINDTEARQWVTLVRNAYGRLLSQNVSEQQLREDYPNLLSFLNLDEQSQIDLLADEQTPMLVRLLKAVYGIDMWLKVQSELDLLPSLADQGAYLHVCLASMAGLELEQFVLEAMAPECDLEARSDHNPWVRTDEGRHVARHPLIAQVVLEQSAHRWQMRDQCIQDYCNLSRTSRVYLEVLRQVALTIDSATAVAVDDCLKRLRSDLRRALRNSLLTVNGLAQLIVSQSRNQYEDVTGWAGVIINLVSGGRGQEQHLPLLDVVDALLVEASSAADHSGKERVVYYQTKALYRRKSICDEITLETLLDLVDQVSIFLRSDWCGPDFYFDAFGWAESTLKLLPKTRLANERASQAHNLFKILFAAYERLRALSASGEADATTHRRHAHWIKYSVHLQLPEQAHELVRDAWELSVELENPNAETAALYVEMLVERPTRSREMSTRQAAQQTAEILRTVAATNPNDGQLLFLVAMLGLEETVEDFYDLDNRVERALTAEPTPISASYLNHAHAYLVISSTEKVRDLRAAAEGYKDYCQENAHFFSASSMLGT